MTTSPEQAEIAKLLRTRRTQIDRRVFGLPDAPRGHAHGLRREEVATLSGVSITWYTWLEQARDVHPSRQVLDALASALQLTTAEHVYLLSLAGFTPPAPAAQESRSATEHIQHLLDAMTESPAFAINSDWSIAAWNRAYEALYPNVARTPTADRNLLLAVYTDPFVRRLLPDWAVTSRRFLAEFRADAGPRLSQPDCRRLVERLEALSPEFRKSWQLHDIESFTSRLRTFTTPVGQLEFEYHRLAACDRPNMYVVVYTPVGSPTQQAISELVRRMQPQSSGAPNSLT